MNGIHTKYLQSQTRVKWIVNLVNSVVESALESNDSATRVLSDSATRVKVNSNRRVGHSRFGDK